MDRSRTKFSAGMIVATRGALTKMEELKIGADVLLDRHLSGDWGDLCEEDKRLNDLALVEGERVLSAYIHNGTKFWVITEWDRSATTILLPEEY